MRLHRVLGCAFWALCAAMPGRALAGATTYLYVENNNSTIAVFTVAKNGALKPIKGSPFTVDTNSPNSFSIAIDPKGPYLYATGSVSENVAILSIGSDGSLTSISSSTVAGGGAGMTALSKKDNQLFVVDSGAVTAFDVNKKSGSLKTVAGSPFNVSCPGFCQALPDYAVLNGSFLYTIDSGGWFVSTFSVAKNGSLTEINSYPTHEAPVSGVMTADGGSLYVTNAASGDISAYSVADGVLTQLSGSPFPSGNTPLGIVMNPAENFLYAANSGDGTISGWSVKGGNLVPVKGSPFADGAGTDPSALAIDKSGKHLFVTNNATSTIAVYAIGASGKIAQIKGSPFPIGSGASGPKGLALYEP